MTDFQDDDIFEFDEEEPLFDEEEEEITFEETEAEPRQNRAFLIGVAVLAAFFVISLIVVILIIIGRPPDEVTLTNTAIVQALNVTQTFEADLTATAVAQANANATLTQEALNAEGTRQAIADITATWLAAITDTPQPSYTPTPEEITVTPTPEEVVTLVTATPGVATPTPVKEPLATPAPSQMPDTGIADDLGLGGSLFVAGLAAVGLLAVMFVARRMRISSYDDDEDEA